MKNIFPEISFSDCSYKYCMANSHDLVIHILSWDNKNIKITFINTIQFIYRGGSFIDGVFEISDNSFMSQALTTYYVKTPDEHPFKTFGIIDMEDSLFFEIIAEKAIISKE